MSLENKIEQLTLEVSTLTKAMQALTQLMSKESSVELPVESFIEEPKAKSTRKKKEPVAEPTPEPVVELTPEPTPEPVVEAVTIGKPEILELAKEKLTQGKATKEDIKAIITAQGFDSLNDIKSTSDFQAIYDKVKEL